ncbi:hypothetical protein H5410_027757 [Solanum commersonii]|uniref:Uncharacterized protein n=1 Tax=Solanum commersonii TaxID=4109 RepID=A0A9J5Z029_SOLCO|nr:hypothetical protein H5410_027757 [Solanum commersonii]
MDNLESHLNSRSNALGYVDGVSLQSQMIALKANISKLVDKSVVLPHLLVPNSLMNQLSMPPVTLPVGDILLDLERPETEKRKENKNTPNTLLPD